MKASSIVVLTAAVVVVALALALNSGVAQTAGGAAGVAKVAVCDIAQVFNKSQQALELSAKFADKRNQIAAQDEERKTKIQQLEKRLESIKPESKEFDVVMGEHDQLVAALQVWQQIQQKQFLTEHRRLTEGMYAAILKKVETVAKDKGFDIVFYKEDVDITSKTTEELLNKIAQRKVLYNNPAFDLTNSVLDSVNADYKAATTSAPERP
jgi:Skp family chaperone for outer membrane proteins